VIQLVWFFVILALILLIWGISTYNRGITVRQNIRECRANIDVQLKRRHDLIPQLVAVVRGYAQHEQELFESIAEARAKAMVEIESARHQYASEGPLVRELKRMIALAEAYPQLKANDQFLALQKELANTEDRIAAARRFFNANVRSWNTLRASFPSSMIVSGEEVDYFEVDGVLSAPSIDLDR